MEEIRNNVILDLKRRAKQSKEENDTDEALQWLKQAKVIEESNGELLPQQLKKLAVYYKQHNDIEAAKDSLIKSKQIEHCLLQQQQQQQSDALKDPTNENDNNDNMEDGGDDDDEALLQLNDEGGGDANIEFTDEEMIDKEMMVEFQSCSMPVPSQELYDQRILHHKKLALAWKQKNDIPKATSALRFAKQLQAVQMALQSNSGGAGGDTDDLDDWMKSLTAEENDLLGELMNDNNTDKEMMEMMIDGAEKSEDDVGQQQSSSNMKFDLKDIETMEDDDILECLKMGMSLPSVDEIQDQATQKQKEAINYKKKGDLESAKSKLAESKTIKSQAERLDRIHKSYNNNNNNNNNKTGEVNDDDLEALLTSSSTKKNQQNQQQEASSAPPPPPQNPWLSKHSAEIKAEVIKLKNEKKVAEATKLLQIYKEVVKKENEAKEKAKCQQLITSLEKQIGFAEEQIKLFCFYERFDDDTNSSIGSEQLRLWKLYVKGCQQVIERISTYGSNSIEISKATTNKLKVVNDDIDIVGLVERVSGNGSNNNTNTNLNGNLEVSIIEVMNIQDNKPYQKFLSKRVKNNNNNESQASSSSSSRPIMEVDVKLQLPLNEDSQHVHMMFHPTTAATTTITQLETSATEEPSATANHQFLFDKSHIVKIPRGDTRQAKTILKRMETKKVQVNISVKPPLPPQEKKSWFFSSSSKGGADASSSEVGGAHLGKIVLDLKDLLSRNCIAGDFQITVNSKEVGGSVRLCIRTDRPFDIHQFEGYVGSRRDNDSNNTHHNADFDEEEQQQLLVPYSNCLSFSEVTSTTTTK